MRSDDADRAPILVLGLGNLVLQDDAVGLRLLDELRLRHEGDQRVDFVDGGTQGIALMALLDRRAAVLLLDAVQQGSPPGTLHGVADALQQTPAAHAGAMGGAHELNAGDLLLAARLCGDLPGRVAVVGIEPATMRTGIGLSPLVEAAVADATALADVLLCTWLAAQEVAPCTN